MKAKKQITSTPLVTILYWTLTFLLTFFAVKPMADGPAKYVVAFVVVLSCRVLYPMLVKKAN